MFKKVLIGILVVILVLALVLVLCAPNLLFNFIFGRPSRSTKIPSYYVDTPHYIVSRKGMEVMKNYPEEDHYTTSFDGLKLHAYVYPVVEQPKKFVIGVHGYRSYARPEAGPYFEFYKDHGYTMLLPDDRAHAPSEGDYIGFGVLDQKDILKWIDYIIDNYGEDVEILLHGVSMGAATVVGVSGEDLPVQVKGIISDCGFTSAHDILEYQLAESMHLPANYLLPKIEKIAIKKAGFNFSDDAPIEKVKNAKVPMLFVHGANDTMVPSFMLDQLYDACGSTNKRKMLVEGAAHGESIAFKPEKYHQNIIELFGLD